MQPCAERGLAPVRVQLLPHPNEDVLQHIVDVLLPHEPLRQALHTVHMSVIQALESFRIAAYRQLDIHCIQLGRGQVGVVLQNVHSTPWLIDWLTALDTRQAENAQLRRGVP